MIQVQDKSRCSGCQACYNKCPKHAIEMVKDKNGFKYPKINTKLCINCGLCDRTCPIINKLKVDNIPEIYVCYNRDKEVRAKSSSGGIFTLLATEIINRGGVVFGAAFNDDFSLSHQYIKNINELDKLRTSKYFQSNIGDTYKKAKEFLDADRYVLFTGTPCQIEGLLSFLGKKYEKLYTQDIVCHGVPSPKVWKKYMEYRYKVDKQNPKKINFRDKKQEGWRLFSLCFNYGETEYAKNQREDLFMRAFLKDVCLRDSCYKCSFRKKNRLSDITLADCWGIENIRPELDDDKGTSLILVNSEKGKELYKTIENSIVSFQTTMDKAIESNPAIIKSPGENKYRDKFFYGLDNEKFDKLVIRCTPKPSLLKRGIGKIKRIVKKMINM